MIACILFLLCRNRNTRDIRLTTVTRSVCPFPLHPARNQVSDSILGLTVLAWGNSIGDLAADTVMSTHGHSKMAVAATFSSPILNIVFSLGGSFLIECIRTFPRPYKYVTQNRSTGLTHLSVSRAHLLFQLAFFQPSSTGDVGTDFYITTAFLVVGLLTTLIVVSMNGFIVPRRYAIVTLLLYVSCTVANVAFTV